MWSGLVIPNRGEYSYNFCRRKTEKKKLRLERFAAVLQLSSAIKRKSNLKHIASIDQYRKQITICKVYGNKEGEAKYMLTLKNSKTFKHSNSPA